MIQMISIQESLIWWEFNWKKTKKAHIIPSIYFRKSVNQAKTNFNLYKLQTFATSIGKKHNSMKSKQNIHDILILYYKEI